MKRNCIKLSRNSIQKSLEFKYIFLKVFQTRNGTNVKNHRKGILLTCFASSRSFSFQPHWIYFGCRCFTCNLKQIIVECAKQRYTVYSAEISTDTIHNIGVSSYIKILIRVNLSFVMNHQC